MPVTPYHSKTGQALECVSCGAVGRFFKDYTGLYKCRFCCKMNSRNIMEAHIDKINLERNKGSV